MALPKGYTQLTYIESTGTQYIDTGYSAPNGFICDAEIEFNTNSFNKSVYFVGAHEANPPYARNGFGISDTNFWELGVSEECPRAEVSPVANVRYRVNVSTVKGNSYLDVDGKRLITSSNADVRSPNNLCVFYNHYGMYFGKETTIGKLYYLKIYNSNGVLVRDFVPCVNSNGEVGMYDLVNSQFYGNDGSGVFVAGELIFGGKGGNTLVNGTVYGVFGGKALVNGTAYHIINGKVLINGTVYEIEFAERVPVFYVNVNGTNMEYPFEIGMTWADFINSEYNPVRDSYGNKIASSMGSSVLWTADMHSKSLTDADGNVIRTTDTIVENYVYVY